MWQKLFFFLLDQVFPQSCLCCSKEGDIICEFCQRHFQVQEQETSIQGILARTFYEYHQHPLFSAVMRQWKYHGDRSILCHLVAPIREFSADVDFLIPIPLHPSRLRERGFNQAEDLALALSDLSGIRVLNQMKRVKKTQAQAKRTEEERMGNVEKAFVWRGNGLANKRVILVDDVVTTGATMRSAADVLQKKGASVQALALFRSERLWD